jgi:lipopolysaccharide heptosyltransferase II
LAFDRGATGWFRGSREFLRFLRQIREQRFDLVVDLQGLLRTGLMTWASRAPRKVGLSDAREGARGFYTDVVTVPRPDMHAVDRYWLVAEALGVSELPKRFTLPSDEASRQWVEERLRSRPRPWVMMSLGTRWETKRWPVEHFVELARRSLTAFGGTIVLVGGPAETNLAQRFCEANSTTTIDLTGKTSLPQLTALLALADVMVSNDSGPLHLAAALNRPVVAPYTCTSPARTGPYGATQGAVPTQVWCAASYLKRCRRLDCMAELTPDRLWPVLKAALDQWQRLSA